MGTGKMSRCGFGTETSHISGSHFPSPVAPRQIAARAFDWPKSRRIALPQVDAFAATGRRGMWVPSQSRCGSPSMSAVTRHQGQQDASHSSPRKMHGVLAVVAMARTLLTAVSAALILLPSSALLAQDNPDQQQPSQSRPLERMEGVPDDFSLQPQSDTARRNRDEPMVQPLPQPSATPTAARATQPVAVPQAMPTPQLTLPARDVDAPSSQRRPAASERAGVPVQTGPAQVDPPVPELNASEQAALPSQEVANPVEPSIVEPAEAESAPEAFDWSVVGWLLLAVIGLAVLAVGVWWLGRRRTDTAFIVEKIEPYRPSSDELARVPSPAMQASSQSAEALKSQPPGLNHATRPAPIANPGGFVTSSIAARPRSQNQPAPVVQTSRRFTSPDGRIVTSLSSTRRSGD